MSVRPVKSGVLHHWQSLVESSPSPLDPIFAVSPQAFLYECAHTKSMSKLFFMRCVKPIRKSEWSNELALIFISMILYSSDHSNKVSDIEDKIEDCHIIMSHCAKIAGGKNNMRHDYYFNPKFYAQNSELFSEVDLDKLSLSLYHALEVVEIVFPTLPPHEQRALSKYRIQFHVDEQQDELEPPSSMETLRDLIGPDVQKLRGTVVDPDWTGAPMERRLLRFLCKKLTIVEFDWSPHLMIYTIIQVSQGEPQSSILARLNNMYFYLFALDFFPHSRCIPPKREINKILRTLEQRPDLQLYAQSFRAIVAPSDSRLSVPAPEGWDDVLGNSPVEHALWQFAKRHSNLQALDAFQRQVTAYLLKWQGTPYFAELTLVAIGLAINTEHRPESAMQILRALRHFLVHVSIQLQATAAPELTSNALLRILEASSLQNPETTPKLHRLALAYGSAWQSQQTLLARTDDFPPTLKHLLLPRLNRRPNFVWQRDLANHLRDQEHQADIDLVADHWEQIHRWANTQFVALRAVMLAFRTATQGLDPRQVMSTSPLDVHIPGRDETWHFRIWTRSLFNTHVFGDDTSPSVREEFFLEYQGVSGEPGTQGLWCEDLFRAWLDPDTAAHFEATWGRSVDWLRPNNVGVLSLGHSFSLFLRSAFKALRSEGRPLPCVFPVDAVYRAALFGALAFRLSREGAQRAHELLQLRQEKEFLFQKVVEGQEMVFMALYPKGKKGTRSRPAKPAFKVVSDSAERALEALQHLNELEGKPYGARLKRQGSADVYGLFAFQANQEVISTHTVNVCLRFLVYSAFRHSKRVPNFTAHVLRHAYAKNARRCGVSSEDLARVLDHANLTTTEYYARPTQHQQLETLTKVARKTGIWATTVSQITSPEKAPNVRSRLVGDVLSELNEIEFEDWLTKAECDFEAQERLLIDRMEGQQT